VRSKFAKVTWSVEDILSLRPHWTKRKCREVLLEIEASIENDMVIRGWNTIEYELGNRYDINGNFIALSLP